MESKGMSMTKAGPAMIKRALYQAGDIARRYDPQLAYLYYREMVHHGKTHLQAMGAVMSHLGARIIAVLKEDKPYDLRDNQGRSITLKEAKELIFREYTVSAETRQARRRRKSNAGRGIDSRMHDAAEAPQSGLPPSPQCIVYTVKDTSSIAG